ncbi:MAG: HypC/HybG/HupF family hydrogenase formation chaperone [Anaerolineales bacterium]|jgi:hydrogenase expression/formation protein HypC
MCLGIPGKIEEMYEKNGMSMGKVDFSGVKKEICLAYLPEVKVGSYVIVHVGFAISEIDEEEAFQTMEMIREIEAMDDNDQ